IFRLNKVIEENQALIQENKSERDFSTLTKARYDELKLKFEQTSRALIEKDREYTVLLKDVSALKTDVKAREAEMKALTEKLEETTEALRRTEGEGEAALESLKNQLAEKDQELDRLATELSKVTKFKDQMMRMMNEI
ncbi:unnamed protein product, partial [Enterobius vermicularis]|uniref:Myosin_tail_1 domain-containing protein n=1 Tax=Enterobius vermicularis TaxID=51028 RepID=A0A0N4VQP6_ENTVE